jgi:hypothetical protein
MLVLKVSSPWNVVQVDFETDVMAAAGMTHSHEVRWVERERNNLDGMRMMRDEEVDHDMNPLVQKVVDTNLVEREHL